MSGTIPFGGRSSIVSRVEADRTHMLQARISATSRRPAGSRVRLLYLSLAPVLQELWGSPITHGQRFSRNTLLRVNRVSP